jgi:sugar phosphate isomerase/epimerase
MKRSRRAFLQYGAAAFATSAAGRLLTLRTYAAQRGVNFRVGVTDWNLEKEGLPEAVALAKQIGFDGVQISLSRLDTGSDWIGNNVLDRFVAESKRVSLPIASVCLNILHRNYLKSDPIGKQRVVDAIGMAKRVGVRVILLPFFGRGAIERTAEMDYVGDALREIAPQAQAAGVILGLEDTISARDNVRIMERTKSPAVLTYYDVGNSTKAGFNVVEEIRWLGKDRICEVHLKDNPNYLGKGSIDFPAIVDALADIGFAEWAELETDAPSGNIPKDLATNLAFIRGLVEARGGRAG